LSIADIVGRSLCAYLIWSIIIWNRKE